VSSVYADEDLIVSARDYTLNALMNITALSDESVTLRRTVRDHLAAVLTAIDDLKPSVR
jgi:hypothetical protein